MYYTTSCNTQSSAPGDGRNNLPKHVELTGIINKPLLLHLVGCLYYENTLFSVSTELKCLGERVGISDTDGLKRHNSGRTLIIKVTQPNFQQIFH